jgi:oxygen-dependent protoporphyrinogen oxidase
MRRVAVIGGGISGLAAAYELEQARRRGAQIDWQLFEASPRLGGIVQTSRIDSEFGELTLEGGPDGWVTEKPWARELAAELGLEADLLGSNDLARRTYIALNHQLVAMPDRMRMMVPETLATLEGSSLFSESAREAYANELHRADQLKAAAPDHDESVSSFVRRHFGDEVLAKIGAPLLSGVFGGDVDRLSVRSVMPAFVTMEREHGSLIRALEVRAAEKAAKAAACEPAREGSIFTSLKRGMGSLAEAIIAALPKARIVTNAPVRSMTPSARGWLLSTDATAYTDVLLAAPVDAARHLLAPHDRDAAALIPTDASSAVLAALVWDPASAAQFSIPEGFGFLVPKEEQAAAHADPHATPMMDCTFVEQKYAHRVPAGARVLRVFFGGLSADRLASQPDAAIHNAAFVELTRVLGPLPTPRMELSPVQRWPRSLPQYEVGHQERLAELDQRVARLSQRAGGLHLLGNGYGGVGVPDLIRDARAAARSLAD